MKRELNVIDRALRAVPKKLWRFHDFSSRLSPSAGRFILTDDASYKLGSIVKNTADLMLKNHQFAIPPILPATYLELNLRLFHQGLGAPTTGYKYGFTAPPDERVGYLVTEDRIIGFTSDIFGESAPTPFSLKKVDASYRHPITAVAFSPQGYGPEELETKLPQIIKETMEWNRLAILLGSSLIEMPDEQTRQAYLDNWAIIDNYPGIDYSDPKYYMSGAGELRTAQAIMLVLNQPSVINLTGVGRSVGLLKGKRTVYASHSVVNISLGERKQYRRLFLGGTHASPRRHRVRGHFVHYRCQPGCVHEWPLFPDRVDPPSWGCRICGGLRVWKKKFMRGDAGKGFTTNEYDVA